MQMLKGINHILIKCKHKIMQYRVTFNIKLNTESMVLELNFDQINLHKLSFVVILRCTILEAYFSTWIIVVMTFKQRTWQKQLRIL